MKLKSDAHDLLLLLFQRDGFPPKNDNEWLQGTNLGQVQKEMPGC
jgi:hypothetical protein